MDVCGSERGVEHDGVDIASWIDAAVDLHLDVVVEARARSAAHWRVVEEPEQSALIDLSTEE